MKRIAFALFLAFGCSSKPEYQAIPVASIPSGEPGDPTLTVDGTLCDRFAACAPALFALEYSDREACLVNLYGSGRGVHVVTETADACAADLSASCDFVSDVDAGVDAGRFPSLRLPLSCHSTLTNQ